MTVASFCDADGIIIAQSIYDKSSRFRLYRQALGLELSAIESDERVLKQIRYNYLSNAVKFTPEEGVGTLRVSSDELSYFRIEVEDTGIGIKAEDMARLFIEFQQLDATSAKKYPGTGLGLAPTKADRRSPGRQARRDEHPREGKYFSCRHAANLPSSGPSHEKRDRTSGGGKVLAVSLGANRRSGAAV